MNRPGNENVTRHTSPSFNIAWLSPWRNRGERDSWGMVSFICRWNFRGPRTCIVLYARGKHRSKNTSLENDIILSRETQPIIQQRVFVARRARTAAALQGILKRGTVVSPSRSRVNRQIFIPLLVGVQLPLHWIQISSPVFARTTNSDASPSYQVCFLECQWRCLYQ